MSKKGLYFWKKHKKGGGFILLEGGTEKVVHKKVHTGQ